MANGMQGETNVDKCTSCPANTNTIGVGSCGPSSCVASTTSSSNGSSFSGAGGAIGGGIAAFVTLIAIGYYYYIHLPGKAAILAAENATISKGDVESAASSGTANPMQTNPL